MKGLSEMARLLSEAAGLLSASSRLLVRFSAGQSRPWRTMMGHSNFDPVDTGPAWNAGRKLGAKRPLKPKEIWAVRFMLDQDRKIRDRALFDLAIDSKLRGCDFFGEDQDWRSGIWRPCPQPSHGDPAED